MMNETKKFVAWEDRPPITFRPGTSDEAIIKASIIDQNEYAFPQISPKIIWDIGANIGVVTVMLANTYPEAKIFAFEPEVFNYGLLELNTASYKNVKCIEAGLGSRTCNKVLFKSDDPINLGGFSTHIKGNGVKQDDISILRSWTMAKEIGIPDLIKIDCEGAEYEILLDMAEFLPQVTWITGELHKVDDYSLLSLLDKKNFEMAFAKRINDPVWHFNALNKNFISAKAPT